MEFSSFEAMTAIEKSIDNFTIGRLCCTNLLIFDTVKETLKINEMKIDVEKKRKT